MDIYSDLKLSIISSKYLKLKGNMNVRGFIEVFEQQQNYCPVSWSVEHRIRWPALPMAIVDVYRSRIRSPTVSLLSAFIIQFNRLEYTLPFHITILLGCLISTVACLISKPFSALLK